MADFRRFQTRHSKRHSRDFRVIVTSYNGYLLEICQHKMQLPGRQAEAVSGRSIFQSTPIYAQSIRTYSQAVMFLGKTRRRMLVLFRVLEQVLPTCTTLTQVVMMLPS